MTELSRRRLIQGAVLTAAVAAVPAANAAGKPKFDEMHDVVVVGSGFARTTHGRYDPHRAGLR